MTRLGRDILFAVVTITLVAGLASGLRFCPGDCNDDGVVTVDEIITGVNIALGSTNIESCSPFDSGGDRRVTVDEILQAITIALGGCPASTPLPSTPTPTAMPQPTATWPVASNIPRRAAGTIEASTEIFATLPHLLSAMANAAVRATNSPSRAPRALISLPFACPGGGEGSFSCDQDVVVFPPSLGPPRYVMAFDACKLATADGAIVTIDGSTTITGHQGEVCGQVSSDLALDVERLSVTSTRSGRTTLATFEGLSGTVSLGGDDPECKLSAFELVLSGGVSVETQATGEQESTSAQGQFDETRFTLDISRYGGDCLPVAYALTVDGNATITTEGSSFAATYEEYRLAADQLDSHNQVSLSGALTSGCFGGRVVFSTAAPLQFGADRGCPDAGRIALTADTGPGAVSYQTGAVIIDSNGDGLGEESYPTCHDPALLVCPSAG